MALSSGEAEKALARNLLSSVLALTLSSDLASNGAALATFSSQQETLCKALEHHNIFKLVTDGKALSKWHTRLMELIESSPKASRLGWKLMLTTVRQSPLERLEALAINLLERAMKALKRQQSIKSVDEDVEQATAAICGVVRVLLLNVELYCPDTRREAQELLAKLLQSLVVLLSSKRRSSNESMTIALLELIATLLCVTPKSFRTLTVKIESACVNKLFFTVDGSAANEEVVQKATVCLALLCNASDMPQQKWSQMSLKSVEAAHQQLDLLAGKRATTTALTEEDLGTNPWVQEAVSQQSSVYQRADVTLNRMNCALMVLHELLSVRTGSQSRGHITEREVQQVLPHIIQFARRAMGVRAHEVGKHTGVSDDGARLPLSVVYAVLPRVYVQALRILSASIERAGICALRHASKIMRVLLLAFESVGDGEDLQALAHATAVCAHRLGASTVEKFGVPLLYELVSRCKRCLDETTSTSTASRIVASAVSAQQNDSKNTGYKSKKRKRQAAVAATLAALKGGNADPERRFVTLRDECILALTFDAVMTAIAGCVSVYGGLLPQQCRSSASELVLKAVKRRRRISSQAHLVIDPVALALLSDAMTTDTSGSHGTNLLRGLRYWQNRNIGSNDTLSTFQLVALNAGEAVLHPRAPPMTIALQNQNTNKEQDSYHFGANLKPTTNFTVQGDALDWDEIEQSDSAEKDEKAELVNVKHAKSETRAVTEEDDEEDYDDVRPQATSNEAINEQIVGEKFNGDIKNDEATKVKNAKSEGSAVTEEEEDDEEDYDDVRPKATFTKVVNEEIVDKKYNDVIEKNEPTTHNFNEKPIAMVEADDYDDDFPDIVVEDD